MLTTPDSLSYNDEISVFKTLIEKKQPITRIKRPITSAP